MTHEPQPGPDVVDLPVPRHREAAEVFGGAYLIGPVTDRMWARSSDSYRASSVLGVLEPDDSVGALTRSFDTTLTVPGGTLRAAGVTSVGVRADRRRRGYLRALMYEQLTRLRSEGVVAATLRATEGGIYSRFGYGIASRYATATVDPTSARLRPGVAQAGRLHMIGPEEALRVLPDAYECLGGDRPGHMSRPRWWWPSISTELIDKDRPVWVLVSVGDDDEIDGWVSYTARAADSPAGRHRVHVTVLDLVGAGPAVELILWRAVLGIDLADSIVAPRRPLDDALPLALVNGRDVHVSAVEDETWLRLLDVGAALSARTYGDAEPVVLGVVDEVFTDNTARYEISADGARRTEAPADVELDVAELAHVYLGDTRPSALARAGRLRGDGDALRRADVLLAPGRAPWCGTYF